MPKSKTRKPGPVTAVHAPAASVEAESREQPGSTQVLAPRQGSKQALLVGLLMRSEGASIADLIGATGWLPHTTRAALSGLRKRGFAVDRVTGEGGPSVYRIAAPEPEPRPEPKRRPARRRWVEGDVVQSRV